MFNAIMMIILCYKIKIGFLGGEEEMLDTEDQTNESNAMTNEN